MDTPSAAIPSVSPQPAIQPEVSPAEPQSRHWLLWLAGGLTFLILGIAIGIFTAKFLSQSQSPSPLISTPTASPSPQSSTPIPTPDLYREPNGSAATADWKRYTSSKYQYVINIPPDWEKLAGPPEEEYFNIRKDDYEIGLTVFPTIKTTIQEYLVESDKESATAWEGTPLTKVVSTRLTKIGNYNVVRRKEEWLAAGFSKPVLNTYFLNGGFIYSFTLKYIGPTTDSNIIGNDTYDQILSTFKFTD